MGKKVNYNILDPFKTFFCSSCKKIKSDYVQYSAALITQGLPYVYSRRGYLTGTKAQVSMGRKWIHVKSQIDRHTVILEGFFLHCLFRMVDKCSGMSRVSRLDSLGQPHLYSLLSYESVTQSGRDGSYGGDQCLHEISTRQGRMTIWHSQWRA